MSSLLDNFGPGRDERSSLWTWLLVLSLVVFTANTMYAVSKAARFGGASTAASSLQVNSQRLANQGRDAVEGKPNAFAAFKETRAQIETGLKALNTDFGSSQVGGAIGNVKEQWAKLAPNADVLIASEQVVSEQAVSAERFAQAVVPLQTQLDDVVRAMSASGAPASQIYIALRQVVLLATMARHVTEIRAGGEGAKKAGDDLRNQADIFDKVMTDMRQGGSNEVRKVSSGVAMASLNRANAQWQSMKSDLDAILASSDKLFSAQAAAAALAGGSNQLLSASQQLFRALTAFGSLRDTSVVGGVWVSIVSGLFLLVSLVFWYLGSRRKEREDLQHTIEDSNRNLEAIMRLLDEIGALAENDLTVRATVTEDMTGAIADSINFAVDNLRALVTTINDTSVQVASSAQETQATAMHLAEAAEHQAHEIMSASSRITEIASSIDHVSRNSAESAAVAERSVQIATKGAGVVRETIAGMDSIRGQIQETSKRIKRLGESSQEIGSIVELISDISEQTNILALNAAIQAASAGESGRGFAVVADEVQRLAERASNATKRIELLVQTIQADTNEAVSSMEQTTAEVVAGARLAEDAGTALGEIENVSTSLADLIQGISQAAQQQSAAASNITTTMNTIQSITAQTSQGAGQTAASIGTLAQLAADLRRSVADFKLPA